MDTPLDYELLAQQIEALAQADNHWLPVLSNASACLFEAMDNINWAGFYLVDESTRDQKTPELRLRAHSLWAWRVWNRCGRGQDAAGLRRARVSGAHCLRCGVAFRGGRAASVWGPRGGRARYRQSSAWPVFCI